MFFAKFGDKRIHFDDLDVKVFEDAALEIDDSKKGWLDVYRAPASSRAAALVVLRGAAAQLGIEWEPPERVTVPFLSTMFELGEVDMPVTYENGLPLVGDDTTTLG